LLRETKSRFPDNAHCRTILAELLRDKGATDEAETLLRETKSRFPDDEVCRNILAELLRDKGATDEAETLLRETTKDFPKDPVSRYLLDKLLKDRGNVVEAETPDREVRQLNVNHEPSRKAGLEVPLERIESTQTQKLGPATVANLPKGEASLPLLDKTINEEDSGRGELRMPQFGQRRGISTSAVKRMDHSEPSGDDDPFILWAAERAPLIRWVYRIGQPDGIQVLLDAARNGGAAELAEAAIRLLFPQEALPVADALRARPASLVLRLFQSGRNADLGLGLIETAPEAESVLRDLYQADADPSTWDARFRDAVLACADLTPPPAWHPMPA
ncbi:MAG: tetratricopeptide repeat protein, partial [Acetobacteraceae bacterium]